MSKKLKILLIEGNARQVLPMAKELRKLGHEITTYNSSKFDFGFTSRYPHHKIISYSNPIDELGTLQAVADVLKNNKFDLVIPMNDDMAILLAKHKDLINTYSSVAVNDWNIFNLSCDKMKTMDICMKHDIPCPKTLLSNQNLRENLANFKFPVVVKPRTGCGAVGFHISNDFDDVVRYLSIAEKKYGPCLIQEYIPQTDLQYKAELYLDRNGDIKSAVVFAKVRWYPVNGGSSTLNVTVDRPDIIDSCIKLLKTISWRGYADVDLIQDPRDNLAKIIEINPRITGSVKICFEAGVNFARQIVEDYLEIPVTQMLEYKKNVFLRYLQKDVLWFIKSPNRFTSSPSWFNFKNSVDQIFDFNDPMPFLMSSLKAIPNLYKDTKKRKTKR